MILNLNWINERYSACALHHNEPFFGLKTGFFASLLEELDWGFSPNFTEMGYKFWWDQLITLTLFVSRGQTASIWRVRMQMDVGTEHWRVEVTDSSSSPSCPPTPSVTLAMSRVPSPPPPAEMSSGPVAESWCYTQVEWPLGQVKCWST